MGTIKEQIEETRAQIANAEQRIGRQRRRVERKLVERHPADEAQAELLIMEQNLISMTRYLAQLVSDLEATAKITSPRSKTSRKPKSSGT